MTDRNADPPNLADFMGTTLHYIWYIRDDVTREIKGIELVNDNGVKIVVYAKDSAGKLLPITVEKEVG